MRRGTVGNVDRVGGIQLHRLRVQIDGSGKVLFAQFGVPLRFQFLCLFLVPFTCTLRWLIRDINVKAFQKYQEKESTLAASFGGAADFFFVLS